MLHKPRAHRAQVFSAQEFHDDLLDDNGDDIDARISFHLHSRWTDATHIDPRSWVYGLHHIVGSVSGTIADGGVGKSSLVITESIAMATERNLLGVQPNGRQRVLYWNGEEPLDEIERRVHAACQQYKIDPEPLTNWLFVMSGLDHPITVATVGRNGVSFDDVIINTLSETRRRLRRRPSLPSWSLAARASRRTAERLGLLPRSSPLAFYRRRSFYVMRTDAFDRFCTRLEQRFTRMQITDMLRAADFDDIRFSEQEPFWVAVATKQP